MNIYCDGATTRVCYIFEGERPTVLQIPKGTSNQGEYWAVINALLEATHRDFDDVTILSDSQLIVRQLGGDYKIRDKGLQVLAYLAQGLASKIDKVEYKWIPREENPAGKVLG